MVAYTIQCIQYLCLEIVGIYLRQKKNETAGFLQYFIRMKIALIV